MLLFPLAQVFVFHYMPLPGIVIAFKEYHAGLGIRPSQWNQFEHFRTLFHDSLFIRALKNTIVISGLKLIFGFAVPIAFALLLNEIKPQRFKKLTQSVSYLPHFMSWVILSGMIVEVLSPQRGIINYAISLFGGNPINFLANKTAFVPILIVSDIWKEAGWASIIYLAAISSISPDLYEASNVDGASRLQKMRHITLPGLMPVVTILFILQIGQILNGGFDQVLNLYNPLVYAVGDIIDTYVYRVGLVEFRMDYATAVGLLKNVVGVVLLVGTNTIVRKFNDHGVW